MVGSKMIWMSLALVAVGLSGCAESSGPENAAAPVDACVVESPGDFDACADEPVGVDGTVQHVHDYWGGRDRVPVIDGTFQSLTTVLAGNSAFRYQPPAGSVVPQGTASVEITLSWQKDPDHLYSGAELWVQAANQSDSQFISELISGETYTINSTNDMNDLPHQQLSGWNIFVSLKPQAGQLLTRFDGEMTIHMEAIRGLDIPAYPGHPDRWEGQDEIPLFSHDRVVVLYHRSSVVNGNVCSSCFVYHEVDDGIIVPFDASYVEARLRVAPESGMTLDLAYHGADTWEYMRLEPDAIENGEKIYRIPVSDAGDGPYAVQSLWEFQTYPGGLVDDLLTPSAAYTLTASVHRSD